MIFDSLHRFSDYTPIHPLFPTVLDFINSYNLSNIEPGTLAIDRGVHAIASEYATKDITTKFIECHKRYIDMQIVVSGVEQIGICNRDACRSVEEYDENKDVEKLAGKLDFITLRNGYFAVFFPQDGHVPGLKIGAIESRVRKIVLKIPV
jgi:biofilm protein TabA